MSLEIPRLLALDFDGTSHLTGERSADIVDVDTAYYEALSAHISEEAAERYRETGHMGRDPFEIVKDSLPEDTEEDVLRYKSRLVTEAKLALLLECIGKPLEDGTPWPRLTPGFATLWKGISHAKADGREIATSTISAGHTEFQRSAYAVHGLDMPDEFMTVDMLNAMGLKIPQNELAKPATFMLDIATFSYAYALRAKGLPFRFEDIEVHYAGDDDIKDRGLAVNAGVSFELITEESSEEAWARIGERLGVTEYMAAEHTSA